jgi:uncharacterized lipoprotein YmbA
VLGAEGVKLIGLAFQNKMVADLRGGASSTMSAEQMREAGIEAWTIASFVNRYAGPAAAQAIWRTLRGRAQRSAGHGHHHRRARWSPRATWRA